MAVMENWERMFAGVQRLVWEAASLQDGMNRLVAFAGQHPAQYDDPAYWQQAASIPLPFETIMGWVREGSAAFAPDMTHKTALLVLDCGDAPDTFHLQEWRLSRPVDVPELAKILKEQPLLDAYTLEKHLPIQQTLQLAYHNVAELRHPILSWNQSGSDYHGENGYLLWLAVVALAWRECLRDAPYCQSLLKGCDQIFMLAGYEEIFFYTGTISAQGLEF